MQQAKTLLDKQLADLGRVVLRDGGSVSGSMAKVHANTQYEKFNVARKNERKNRADKEISELRSEVSTLPRGRKT
ncbi:MAG: hypothetical protein ACI9HB_002295 [Gammaproteobacteria bacterium]|jgi:hypothetical protein